MHLKSYAIEPTPAPHGLSQLVTDRRGSDTRKGVPCVLPLNRRSFRFKGPNFCLTAPRLTHYKLCHSSLDPIRSVEIPCLDLPKWQTGQRDTAI